MRRTDGLTLTLGRGRTSTATDLMVSMFTASMRANISARDMLLPYVKLVGEFFAEALVPIMRNNKDDLAALGAPSLSSG